jgi:hypothetical protein
MSKKKGETNNIIWFKGEIKKKNKENKNFNKGEIKNKFKV